MALSEEDICNLALLRIGQRQTIDALAENTQEAMACAVLYPLTRDAVLEEFEWPFATRRATLALLAGTPPTNWRYAYSLPPDCIATRFLVLEGTRAPGANQRIPFVTEYDATTQKEILLTDMELAQLSYTARIENPTLYSPLFVQALAWKLAAELALSVPVKPNVGLAMEQKYTAALHKAIAAKLNQQQEDEEPESSYVRERG